ncbi:protein indeterminate-domain 5, chloroplastic [Artemisia annua]|uniref:Protein indeterminate-domain 5, chloroplastic n=1 Tax=Artemisia annua TaxID=35608 RepID=A0A2U1KZK9_ARTAN|nr:protein indeterminate-domain 5, chloroplastic [Artemisia annua]
MEREEEDQMNQTQLPVVAPKKRRNHPDADDVEVIALSPTTLTAKNRFVCELCLRGFPREQNLQLHKRGHNLPWELKQKSKAEAKRKVYLCPVPSCVHHDPSNAIGDITGIKKHYSRKHGEKKYKCEKCMKMRDRFISHRALCQAFGQINYSQTSSAMGSSSKTTTNRNNPSLSVPVTHSGSQISSIQNLTSNSPGITHGESWLNKISLNSLMNRSSVDLNRYMPSQAFVRAPSQQENDDKNQGNVNTKFLTSILTNTTTPCNKNNFSLTGNVKNYENGEGPSLLSSGGSMSDHSAPIYLSRSHTAVTPQLSATAQLQKAGMIGSTSSNTSATNLSLGYASSSLSGPIGGTTFETAKFPVGSKSFDNKDELLNSFISNGNGSSTFTHYAGATYEQEASYQDQSQSIGSKTLVTRDFLGGWR